MSNPESPPNNNNVTAATLNNQGAIFSKKVASKWLENIMSKEYSITVHPKTSQFSQRLLRSLQQQGWTCSLQDEKLVVTSNDALKLANLTVTLKKHGLFVES
jgi:hypothetical protein